MNTWGLWVFCDFNLFSLVSSNTLIMSTNCRHSVDMGRTTPPPLRIKVWGMKQKLTNTVIAKLTCPDGKTDIKCSDTEVSGLKVRVTSKGAKSFIFEKRPKGTGKLRLETLGRGWGKPRMEVATTHKSDSESFIEALQEVAVRVKNRGQT